MLTAVWADVSTINDHFCVEAEDVEVETLYTHNVKVYLKVCYYSCTVSSWNNYLSPVPAKHPDSQQTVVCKSCWLCPAGTTCICSGFAFVFRPFNQHKSFCFWTALVWNIIFLKSQFWWSEFLEIFRLHVHISGHWFRCSLCARL